MNTERAFDLDNYVDDTASLIDSMTGDQEKSDPSDYYGVNGFAALPLADAVEIQELTEHRAFKKLYAELKEIHRQTVVKSKDETVSQDFRTLNASKAIGQEQFLEFIGAMLDMARERTQKVTPDERRRIGAPRIGSLDANIVSAVEIPKVGE
jgi:hypothetical protein